MSKLTRTTTRIIVIIGLAATLVGSTIALSAYNHSASAQGLTSSLKQKASSMLSGGANKTGGGNMTGDEYLQLAMCINSWYVKLISFEGYRKII